MPAVVTRLLAVAELDASDEPRSLSLTVTLLAVLDDDRRIVLLDDRGFTAGMHGGAEPGIWSHQTAAGLQEDVRHVLLPDDDDDPDPLPFAFLTDPLTAAGVPDPLTQLRHAPLDVELGAAVLARLRATAPAP
jgi:hypothetical protein